MEIISTEGIRKVEELAEDPEEDEVEENKVAQNNEDEIKRTVNS